MASPFPIALPVTETRSHNKDPSVLMKLTSANLEPGQKILPKPDEPNVLVTSALPYVNNVPHLGNIIGSTLSADVYARYSRTRNRNTLYICGTDEYGTATETKALEDGVSPQQLCDKYHSLHAQVYEWFQIGFDHFGRTTTPKQTQIAQDVFLKLNRNGYLEQRSMTQLYCQSCSRFLADRYVEGVCPKCSYDDARGDQCDKCGQLLDAVELIKPRCKLCSSSPIQKDSKHMFLRIDNLQPDCEKWARKAAVEGAWSANGRLITESWFKEGLRPFSLTRDLKWGVPVPVEGMEDKVLYVWFDAPIGYPSITANYTDDWEQWWKNPENVKLYQFMGKDNVRFHTVIFPSCLIGSGDPWTMLHHISTTEYLQYEGGKFSKSRNVGVFGDKAGQIGVPPSVWRYYLLANRPEAADSQFAWRDFITRNNSELLANLGNFCNRVLTFMKKYDRKLPEVPEGQGLRLCHEGPLEEEEEEEEEEREEEKKVNEAEEGSSVIGSSSRRNAKFVKDVNSILGQYIEAMEAVKLRPGLQAMMALSARGNLFLTESHLDNNLFSDRRAECDAVMLLAINLIWVLSALIHPFMPETSDSILVQLDAPPRTVPEGGKFSLDLLPGHVIGKASHLFKRIDEKQEEIWRVQFGGSVDSSKQGGDDKQQGMSKKQAQKLAKAEKKKKLTEAAATESQAGGSRSAAVVVKNKTPELIELEKEVKDKGDEVRKAKEALKAKKGQDDEAEKSAADEKVKELLDLKSRLERLTEQLIGLEIEKQEEK
ncbi:putative MES1-methionyl-tRNA synthetase [Violaceomyces palustris]|uniref:MES1-methionyl-tRNA synthetase n=1 Tax=Violaceomyces palustris TaxID=1673888 RepID=A0ACD0P0M2_9BASI|nr:putative MES1-methionyl-tRNA synthetase [Violaceomyces palustris]